MDFFMIIILTKWYLAIDVTFLEHFFSQDFTIFFCPNLDVFQIVRISCEIEVPVLP